MPEQDRPLPSELVLRHIRWQEKQRPDPEAFKKRMLAHSSYNALMREAIRAEEL